VEPKVNFALVVELLVLAVYVLELDSDFLLGLLVDGLPDLSEGSASQLSLEPIVFCHNSVFHFEITFK
jgi:hypothetical protein